MFYWFNRFFIFLLSKLLFFSSSNYSLSIYVFTLSVFNSLLKTRKAWNITILKKCLILIVFNEICIRLIQSFLGRPGHIWTCEIFSKLLKFILRNTFCGWFFKNWYIQIKNLYGHKMSWAENVQQVVQKESNKGV